MKRLLTNAFLASWILATAVLSAGGCGGSGSVSIPAPKIASNCKFQSETYQSGDAMFNACCDASGAIPVPKANPPAVCTPGYGGTNMTGLGFANAGSRALNFAGNAASLGASQGALAGNNQSAATASPSGANSRVGTIDSASNPGSASSGPAPGLSGAIAGSAGGSGSSGGSAAAGSPGFGLAMPGGLSAAPSMPSGPQSFDSPEKVGAYGGGGGGGGGAGGAGAGRGGSGSGFDLAAVLGGGSGGAGAGKAGQGKNLNFGRGLAGDGSGSALGSADPDMYFSLLQPEDNLFKVVERRYQNKQQQWSLADAQKAAAHVTVKP